MLIFQILVAWVVGYVCAFGLLSHYESLRSRATPYVDDEVREHEKRANKENKKFIYTLSLQAACWFVVIIFVSHACLSH